MLIGVRLCCPECLWQLMILKNIKKTPNLNLTLISQAHKVQLCIPGRKKEAVKKQAKKTTSTSVQAKNQDNLKKWISLFFLPLLTPLDFSSFTHCSVFHFKCLSCCRSLSVSSEDTTAEKEKTEEEKEEEAPKDLAAAAEDPAAAAAPPAVREVPAHLQRQAVRKMVPVRILLACIDTFPALFIAFIYSDSRGVWHWLRELWGLLHVSRVCQGHLWLP